jgi:hypothetical protein
MAGFGSANVDKSTVVSGTHEGELVINIPFSDNGSFKGVVQAIPLPASLSNVLPGNEHYLIVLLDYKAYDTISKTGNIKLRDLNYDGYVPVELSVINGTISNLTTLNMPEALKEKYSSLLKKKDLGNPIFQGGSEQAKATTGHYCDTNGNGNVTFGECFSCLSVACAGNQQCAILCALVNVGGTWMIGLPACTASMAASCVWISIWY